MQSVNIHEAKTHLSKLLVKVQAGEEVIISKSGKPVAKLVPLSSKSAAKPKSGLLKGKVWISPDFDAPLPEDVLSAFYGELG